ncbi:uncharacterized protein LOC132126208 [Carassius carassius]|uniref:uncharacterized protein LOC132126208 n=1 Tax=Carassius carassius TaxID=217509 RepID=UPI0028697E9F|nr:uncharacterized protein LOC132126208 [Carassius carassius]
MALDWTFDFSQDDIPQLRRWWCSLLLQNMSHPRLSESTITKQPASTETVMGQDDSDEKIEEELKRKFIRDIGVAWCWVQSHCELFHGEVTEPEFLQMDEEKQSNIIKDYLKRETEKARDACVFVFDNREDMETFLLKCVDEQGPAPSQGFLISQWERNVMAPTIRLQPHLRYRLVRRDVKRLHLIYLCGHHPQLHLFHRQQIEP